MPPASVRHPLPATTPWVVVVFHQPFLNSNTAHAIAVEGAPVQQAVEALLYAARVDVVSESPP